MSTAVARECCGPQGDAASGSLPLSALNTGSYTIAAAYSDSGSNGNFKGSNAATVPTFTINPATLTITPDGGKTKNYGATHLPALLAACSSATL